MSAAPIWLRHQRPIVIGLVLLGIAERAAWNALRPTRGAAGEALNVAKAVGEGRGFADAYQAGQGATAHLLPINPGLAGLIYRIFGVGSPVAEFILASWSIGLAMGTYLLLFRAFARLGLPLVFRLGALAFACLTPAYIGQEAVDFRVWEGGLAVFLGALFLDRLLAASQSPAIATHTILSVSLLNAVLFFVNPPMGVACYVCAVTFAARNFAARHWGLAAAASTIVLTGLITPWTLRNMHEIGDPVLLRSNAGLELALANYPGALDNGDRKQQFLSRLNTIHPVVLPAYREMLIAGGEVAYARQLGEQARSWIVAHPTEFARLALRHARQTLVPERWQFDVFGRNLSPTLRVFLTGVVGLGGILGIILALIQQRKNWIYPTLIIATLTLITSPFQPVTRYTYLLYPFMLFLLANCLRELGHLKLFGASNDV